MSQKYWSDKVGDAAVFGLFHVELTSEVRDLGDYCTRKLKLSPISKVCSLNLLCGLPTMLVCLSTCVCVFACVALCVCVCLSVCVLWFKAR